MIKRILSFIGMLLLLPVAYSVQVIQSSQSQQTDGWTYFFGTIITFLIIGVVIVIVLGAFVWFIVWSYNKLVGDYRGKKDFLYYNAMEEVAQCSLFSDSSMRYKSWKTAWIMYKRHPVFIDDGENLVPVGLYNGEMNRRTNFFIISLYNKTGIFSYDNSLIILPYELKNNIVRRINVGGKKALILSCHGLDIIPSMPYYKMVLIKKHEKDKTFIDYVNLIREKYVDDIVDKNVIKESMLSYREVVKKATDTNPYINVNRKKE